MGLLSGPPKGDIGRLTEKEDVVVRGKLASSLEERARHSRAILRAESVSSKSCSGKVLVRFWGFSPALGEGEEAEIRGVLSRPEGAFNPGQFDYPQYLASHGIFSILDVNRRLNARSRKSPAPHALALWVECARRKIRESIEHSLPKEEAGALLGILVGERSLLSREIIEDFRDAGLLHVLVVSGGNVVFIALIAYFVLRRLLFLPGVLAQAGILPVIFFYAWIVGADPPVVRATFMTSAGVFALLIRRESAVGHAVALSALFILWGEPRTLFDGSFQLSFAATMGILFLTPKMWRWLADFPKPILWLLKLALVSLAAQISVLPLLAFYFHRVSLVAILSNMLLGPFVGALLAMASALVVSSFFGGWLYSGFALVNHFLMSGFIFSVRFFADLPGAAFSLGTPRLWGILILYAGLFLFVVFERRSWLILLISASAFAVSVLPSPPDGKLRIHVLSLYRGGSTLLEFPGGERWLVDAGSRSEGEQTVSSFLWHKRISRLTAWVLYRADASLAEGFQEVAKHFSTAIFLETKPPDPQTAKILAQRGIPRRRILDGEKFSLKEGVAVEAIAGEGSVSLLIRWKNFSTLLGADSFRREKSPENLDVLVLPARRARDAEIFETLRPKHVIITGEASGISLRAPTQFHFTQKEGEITVEFDGESLHLLPYRRREP